VEVDALCEAKKLEERLVQREDECVYNIFVSLMSNRSCRIRRLELGKQNLTSKLHATEEKLKESEKEYVIVF
jgi:hypothetical protein